MSQCVTHDDRKTSSFWLVFRTPPTSRRLSKALSPVQGRAPRSPNLHQEAASRMTRLVRAVWSVFLFSWSEPLTVLDADTSHADAGLGSPYRLDAAAPVRGSRHPRVRTRPGAGGTCGTWPPPLSFFGFSPCVPSACGRCLWVRRLRRIWGASMVGPG